MKMLMILTALVSLNASALVRNKTIEEKATEAAVRFGRSQLVEDDVTEPTYRIGRSEGLLLKSKLGIFVEVKTLIQDRKTGNRATFSSIYKVETDGQKVTGVINVPNMEGKY